MPRVSADGSDKVAGFIRRDQLKPGQLFQVKGGRNTYGHIATNGKLFGLNMKTGGLSSTSKGSSKVSVVGNFSYTFNLLSPEFHQDKLRRDIGDEVIFVVRGGEAMYAAMGKIDGDTHFLSINLNGGRAFNDNYSVTGNGNSRVTVVGNYGVLANRS